MSERDRVLSKAVERALDGAGQEADAGAEYAAAVRNLGQSLARPASDGPGQLLASTDTDLLQLAAERLRHALLEQGGEDVPERLTLLRRLDRLVPPSTEPAPAVSLMRSGGLDPVIEVAHDLRSPLTSIMFLAETLRAGHSGPVTDTQRQQLGIIYSAALGLHSVANDLMELARAGEGERRAAESDEPFSLAALFESVYALVRPMLEEKGLRLRYELPRIDRRVGQVVPLSRALLNLMTNAIKFTEEGGIEVLARERGGARVEFSVRDSGRGMDAAMLDTLFDTFRKGETETGYRFSDTGLGLEICRRMVGAMGGELDVETELGVGTRFVFEISLPPAGLDEEGALLSGEEGRGEGSPGAEGE